MRIPPEILSTLRSYIMSFIMYATFTLFGHQSIPPAPLHGHDHVCCFLIEHKVVRMFCANVRVRVRVRVFVVRSAVSAISIKYVWFNLIIGKLCRRRKHRASARHANTFGTQTNTKKESVRVWLFNYIVYRAFCPVCARIQLLAFPFGQCCPPPRGEFKTIS